MFTVKKTIVFRDIPASLPRMLRNPATANMEEEKVQFICENFTSQERSLSLLTGDKLLFDTGSKIFNRLRIEAMPQMSGDMPQMSSHVSRMSGDMPQMSSHVSQTTGDMPQMSSHVSRMTGDMPQMSGHVSQTTGDMPYSIEDVNPFIN
jgi:hypothetical protein